MIDVINKNKCCGCSACVTICPQQCIEVKEDDKGFSYPIANKEQCVDCHLCERVCPMLNGYKAVAPQKVSAAFNPSEDVRLNSSSGGLFSMLAEKIIDEGGVVFGAIFNEKLEVVHTWIDDVKNLSSLRGSKYSQSIIGTTYKQALDFLETGRKVLFSGTGCQIEGLILYLRKQYENLITVEIACHGVPSPLVWREYVRYVSKEQTITNIVFRDKRLGWNKYGLSIKSNSKEVIYERATENDFMQCFLNDLCMRPSCTNCPAKAGASGADILFGDFWGIDGMHPEMHDDKGCSLVICYSKKGKNIYDSLSPKSLDTSFEEAFRYNPCIIKPSHESHYAPIFWYNFRKHGINAAPITLKLMRSSKVKRMIVLGLFKIAKTVKIIQEI